MYDHGRGHGNERGRGHGHESGQGRERERGYGHQHQHQRQREHGFDSGPYPPASDQHTRRCSHCQYPISEEPVHGTEDDDLGSKTFCSGACRDAAAADEIVRDHGYKRFQTGVEPLDTLAPDGIPSDAFVLLAGDEGTRRSELTTELVWRALTRGEPATIIAYANPPTAVLERFFALEWNVLPYLETERLQIIDCFSARLEDRENVENALNDWNRFVADVAEELVIEVRDPSDVREVTNALDRALDDLEMTETGVVVLDSIDEIDTLIQDRIIHNFIKDIRASVCKARFVPIFASATTSGDNAYPVDDEYIFDGIVDLRLTDHLVPETRLTQMGIRKLTGGPAIPQWLTYAHRPFRGLFTFDPAVETAEVFAPESIRTR